MKNLFLFLLIVFGVCRLAQLQAQDNPVEKFIGVWNTDESHLGAMKISRDENGSVLVQIKQSGGAMIKSSNVVAYDGYLEFTIVNEIIYGKFWIGSWGGWYDSDRKWVRKRENEILVGHDDGSYGTNGEVTGFYSNVYRKTANKEIGCCSYRIIFRQEGNLELRACYHSDYCFNDEKLFYQASNWVLWADYTNW